ncbi:MAG: hypothetical protein AB7E95_14495 [Kiritimatiellales bacterium]
MKRLMIVVLVLAAVAFAGSTAWKQIGTPAVQYRYTIDATVGSDYHDVDFHNPNSFWVDVTATYSDDTSMIS